MATLKYGPDRDRERAEAGAAFVEARAVRLALDGACALGFATMRTETAIGPAQAFKVSAGFGLT